MYLGHPTPRPIDSTKRQTPPSPAAVIHPQAKPSPTQPALKRPHTEPDPIAIRKAPPARSPPELSSAATSKAAPPPSQPSPVAKLLPKAPPILAKPSPNPAPSWDAPPAKAVPSSSTTSQPDPALPSVSSTQFQPTFSVPTLVKNLPSTQTQAPPTVHQPVPPPVHSTASSPTKPPHLQVKAPPNYYATAPASNSYTAPPSANAPTAATPAPPPGLSPVQPHLPSNSSSAPAAAFSASNTLPPAPIIMLPQELDLESATLAKRAFLGFTSGAHGSPTYTNDKNLIIEGKSLVSLFERIDLLLSNHGICPNTLSALPKAAPTNRPTPLPPALECWREPNGALVAKNILAKAFAADIGGSRPPTWGEYLEYNTTNGFFIEEEDQALLEKASRNHLLASHPADVARHQENMKQINRDFAKKWCYSQVVRDPTLPPSSLPSYHIDFNGERSMEDAAFRIHRKEYHLAARYSLSHSVEELSSDQSISVIGILQAKFRLALHIWHAHSSLINHGVRDPLRHSFDSRETFIELMKLLVFKGITPPYDADDQGFHLHLGTHSRSSLDVGHSFGKGKGGKQRSPYGHMGLSHNSADWGDYRHQGASSTTSNSDGSR